MFARQRDERLGPLFHQAGEPYLLARQFKLAVFILAEVEDLVDEPFENPDILAGYAHEVVLQGRKVVGVHHLFHRFCNQRERCAQVVRHVGEEHQFRLRGGLQLRVEFLLFVALLFEQLVLFE